CVLDRHVGGGGLRSDHASTWKGSLPGKFSSRRSCRPHEGGRKSQVVGTACWNLDISRRAFCSRCAIPWSVGSQTDLGGSLFSGRNHRRKAGHAMVEWQGSRL